MIGQEQHQRDKDNLDFITWFRKNDFWRIKVDLPITLPIEDY